MVERVYDKPPVEGEFEYEPGPSDVDRYIGGRSQIYEYQAPAVLNQAAPVNGTFYDILAATANVRVMRIAVNVEDANEDLEVQAIVDGETIAAVAETATHSTTYFAFQSPDAVARTDRLALATATSTVRASMPSHLFDGKSVQVQVRKTSANGAGNLTGIVQYGVLKDAR